MKRRELLGLLGGGALATAGCLVDPGGGSDQSPDPGEGAGPTVAGTSPPVARTAESPAASATAETPRVTASSVTEPPESRSPTETPTASATRAETETGARRPTRTPGQPFTPRTAWTPTAAGTCPDTGVNGDADEPGDGWPRIDVDADRSPYAAVEMDVTLLSQFTDTCPAALRISLTNVSDETIASGMGWSFPFSEYWSGDDEKAPTLYALPVNTIGAVETTWAGKSDDDGLVPTERSNGCWNVRITGDYDAVRFRRIEPGATLSDVYKVFDHPGNAGCLPPGDYRFERDPFLGRHNDGFDEPWGYSLSIEY